MQGNEDDKGLEWQAGIWDQMSKIYAEEVDERFVPVIEGVIARAALSPGEQVLDLGTGTGSVTFYAAPCVGADGFVIGSDISLDMLRCASARARKLGLQNVAFREGGAESIPAKNDSFDVVLASLSLMYVIDRAKAAREIARVLRNDGRLVAAVWGQPDECDIVRFQDAAARFAPRPPVEGVGPGSMQDCSEFIDQLAHVGLRARVESASLGFGFEDFDSAWTVLAGVTAAKIPEEKMYEARETVRALIWGTEDGPRYFRNTTQFIVAGF